MIIGYLALIPIPGSATPQVSDQTNVIDSKEKRILKLVEELAIPLDANLMSYRWQTAESGKGLINGISSKIVFQRKGEVDEHTQRMGSGLYVSKTVYDSSSYIGQPEGSIIQCMIQKFYQKLKNQVLLLRI
jgi:hypothetical protein